jgi:16S rRNA (cytidine1402-2'-O)-methyltransferase
MRLQHTAIVYESPVRVRATLTELADAGAGTRPAVVARELTKRFEEFARGTVAELAARFSETAPRGEVVIVIAASAPEKMSEDELRAVAARLRGEGLSAREIVERLTGELGAGRNIAYRLAHEE